MTLIERLAVKWHHENCCDSDEIDEWEPEQARWWLNAIADELDENSVEIHQSWWQGWEAATQLLRSQASDGSSDE